MKGTTKDVSKEELVRKWRQGRRQGLDQGMDEINTALDNLRISLPQWSSIHPMFQLMEEARQIFSTINNNNSSQTIETKIGERIKGNSSHNLPSGFNSDEAWNAYIRKVIGTHSFLKDEESEKTVKFSGGFKEGYYL